MTTRRVVSQVSSQGVLLPVPRRIRRSRPKRPSPSPFEIVLAPHWTVVGESRVGQVKAIVQHVPDRLAS